MYTKLCTFHHGQQHHDGLEVICRVVINSAHNEFKSFLNLLFKAFNLL